MLLSMGLKESDTTEPLNWTEQGAKSHTPNGKNPRHKKESSIVTNSIKTLKMVHIKKKKSYCPWPLREMFISHSFLSDTSSSQGFWIEGAHHFVVLPEALSFPFLLPPLRVGFSKDSVSSSLLFLLRVWSLGGLNSPMAALPFPSVSSAQSPFSGLDLYWKMSLGFPTSLFGQHLKSIFKLFLNPLFFMTMFF